ncbi:hypothetical protein BH11CYA1_BH11CYA1_37900 [soil metagenome]
MRYRWELVTLACKLTDYEITYTQLISLPAAFAAKMLLVVALFIICLMLIEPAQRVFATWAIAERLFPDLGHLDQANSASALASAVLLMLPAQVLIQNLFYSSVLGAEERKYVRKTDITDMAAVPFFAFSLSILAIECLINLAKGIPWETMKEQFPGFDALCDWLYLQYRKAVPSIFVFNIAISNAISFSSIILCTLVLKQGLLDHSLGEPDRIRFYLVAPLVIVPLYFWLSIFPGFRSIAAVKMDSKFSREPEAR